MNYPVMRFPVLGKTCFGCYPKFEVREIKANSFIFDNLEDFVEPKCDWYLHEVVYNVYHEIYKIRYAVDETK